MSDSGVKLIVDILTNEISIPVDKLFPFMDLLRGCSLHSNFTERLCTMYRLDDVLSTLMEVALNVDQVKTAHTFLFLQVICNFLVSSTSRDATLDFISKNQSRLLGSAGNCFSEHKHKHVLNSYATLLLNVSVHAFNEHNFGGDKTAIMFSQDVVDRALSLMKHVVSKANSVSDNAKKMKSMLGIAKRCYVAIGTIRVRASVNTDTTVLTDACNEIKKLDSSWSQFYNMGEKCVAERERK